MADWYVSSAAQAAVPVFAVSTAYTVGQFVRRITSTLKAQWVFRVTTAGTSAASEPTWPTGNNGTVTSGGAVFTNVTGQSTYGWSAAAGDIPTLVGAVGANRFIAGDRMFVSSDHAETQTSSFFAGTGSGASGSFTGGQVLSVNRAGSVPPVAADLTPGASVTAGAGTGFFAIESTFPLYHYGMNYIATAAINITFNQGSFLGHFMDSCQLYLNNSGSTTARIINSGATNLVLFNTTLRFTNTLQGIATANLFDLTWLGASSGLAGATIPAILFKPASSSTSLLVTVRGVDLSAVTGTLVTNGATGGVGSKYLFDSCRIASGVVRYVTTALANTSDLVELVNCYDGTSFISEAWQPSGAVTTERTITLSGGATDDVGTFSHKLVSNTNIDKWVNVLNGFWMDIEQQAIGSIKTATVEIISSASLNNDEISLLLEYQGTASSSVASITTTLPATVLTAAAAVTASTATWNSSPATPVKQKLVATFTPQVAGRVRGRVRLGKVSATVYVNPVIAIT